MNSKYNLNFKDFVEYSESSPSGLRWKVSRGSSKVGDVAGNIKGNGYFQFGLFGKNFGNHVIIWMLHHGPIPGGMLVDHIDTDCLNNLISNLRLGTQVDNCRNRKPLTGKTSEHKGVCWHKASSRWKAKIVVNYKSIHLGYFDDECEAATAYENAANRHYGDFAYNGKSEKAILP